MSKSGQRRAATDPAGARAKALGPGTRAPLRLGRPPKGKTLLSLQRLLKEALGILDEHGLEALSMRTLGERLGVTAMSLYRYCESHDSLLDAVHDEILAAHMPRKVAAEQSWREVTTDLARALRRAFAAHPKAALLFATRSLRTARWTPPIELVLRRIVDAGFDDVIAANLLNAVVAFTIGHGLAEFYHSTATETAAASAAQPPTRGSSSSETTFELSRRPAPTARPHDFEAEFVVGLLAILDGFSSRYAKRGRCGQPIGRA